MAGTILEKYGSGKHSFSFPVADTAPVEKEEVKTEDVSIWKPSTIVEKAGGFALRAVVVIVATGLIMLGFYFIFQSNIKDIAKAVIK